MFLSDWDALAQLRKRSQREMGKGAQSEVAGTAEDMEILWKLRNVRQVKNGENKIKIKERGK